MRTKLGKNKTILDIQSILGTKTYLHIISDAVRVKSNSFADSTETESKDSLNGCDTF